MSSPLISKEIINADGPLPVAASLNGVQPLALGNQPNEMTYGMVGSNVVGMVLVGLGRCDRWIMQDPSSNYL
eukprot:scaffold11587_cov49-Cyclotella_meneghiniana.AAC.1